MTFRFHNEIKVLSSGLVIRRLRFFSFGYIFVSLNSIHNV